MANNESVKITYVKNLNKLNFNSTISVAIDSNVNIKTVLNVDSYIYDTKVETGSSKAVISGKIGVNVLYIDTDNMTNTISDSQNFSETYVDNSISSDCFISIINSSVMSNVLSSDGILKINCDISIEPVEYLNLSMPNNLINFENMITKKEEITTSTISNTVNSNFEYTTNLETNLAVSKILYCNSSFTVENVTPYQDYALVEGKLNSKLIFETMNGDEVEIKEISKNETIKNEISIQNLTSDSVCDLNFSVDKSKTNISTEVEDNTNIITVQNTICVSGVVLKEISLDVIDDLYSAENEIEIVKTNREFNKSMDCTRFSDVVNGEITLLDDETAIDDIVSNLNAQAEITNSYVKEGQYFVEGVVTSHLIYVDENKELKQKQLELPFVINTKIALEKAYCTHSSATILDCRTRVKRGTIIELEYSLCLTVCSYKKEEMEMIDNVTIGKSLDFGAVDFQIFIAKPNETMWDLCKRIKARVEDVSRYNKDLPLVMEGGEKIIIKR